MNTMTVAAVPEASGRAEMPGTASTAQQPAKAPPALQVDRVALAERSVEMKPLIITVAPLGAELEPGRTEHLHYTREAFSDMVVRCAHAGASIVHIHCRTEEGENTHALARFAEISDAVQQKCRTAGVDIVQQYSTGGSVEMTESERAAPLALNPEMATLSCGSVNFGEQVFVNRQALIEHLAAEMCRRKIVPEIEAFELGHLDTAKRLVKDGHLDPPIHIDFVLGVPGGAAGKPEYLKFFVQQLPEDWSWAVAGIGRAELELARIAIEMGGHVRVGLEDNIYLEKGVLAKNEELVARVAQIARDYGRPVATAAQTRTMLGITAPPESRYVETA